MKKHVPILIVVTLVVAAAATYVVGAWRDTHRLTPDDMTRIPERLASVPLKLDEPRFGGTQVKLDPEIIRKSGADHCLAVEYRNDTGRLVRLHIGAAARTDAWFHPPAVCLPAHGWRATRESLVPFWSGLPGAEPDALMHRLILSKADTRMLVYYWVHYGESVVTSRAHRRRVRFADLLEGRRDRPAHIVIFYAPMDDEDDGEARIESLARGLWPYLAAVSRTEA